MATPPDPVRRRISARVRILLWLLLVMAVGLVSVATTTRSILLRDVDHRANGLLAQEAGEFANFEERGVDPETGRPFTDPSRLLREFLVRQYADPDEELIGLVGRAGDTPAQIIQPREIPVAVPLHEDTAARRRIFDSPASSGTVERSSGEIRWAKVAVARAGGETEAAFVVAFHPGRQQAAVNAEFRILLAISGVALLLTTGIGWAVAGRILKPVRLVRTAPRSSPSRTSPAVSRCTGATTSPRSRRPSTRCSTGWSAPSPPSASSSTTRATSCARRSPSCAATWS